jgi:hypothetical protein
MPDVPSAKPLQFPPDETGQGKGPPPETQAVFVEDPLDPSGIVVFRPHASHQRYTSVTPNDPALAKHPNGRYSSPYNHLPSSSISSSSSARSSSARRRSRTRLPTSRAGSKSNSRQGSRRSSNTLLSGTSETIQLENCVKNGVFVPVVDPNEQNSHKKRPSKPSNLRRGATANGRASVRSLTLSSSAALADPYNLDSPDDDGGKKKPRYMFEAQIKKIQAPIDMSRLNETLKLEREFWSLERNEHIKTERVTRAEGDDEEFQKWVAARAKRKQLQVCVCVFVCVFM